jgi:small subunit ribosomal protein S1
MGESEKESDFAALFEASLKATQYRKGQTVEGTIVAIGPEVAFVDVGGKGEAVIDIAELKNADGVLEFAAGDRIQATVTSTAEGVTLSRKLMRGAATARQLAGAFEAGLPVEGRVERSVKGGYEIRIAGERAFCPLSQIDIVRTADPAAHEGRVYTFQIIEYKEGGKNLVVSRRALLEAEQRASAAEVRRSIVPGAILTGRVVSVRDFGAFVDLGGGVQGLLHVSEMGWSRVSNASQIVAAGEEITVKVLRVDEATQKVALGLKQLTEDPWSHVGTTYEVGQVRTGRVTRVAEFGAFVELEPGVEGLAHASTFAPTGGREEWRRQVPVGMSGAFEILSVDLGQKRIGVALVEEGSARALQQGSEQARAAASRESGIVPGARLTGKVERHEKFGVFVFLAPGRTGLMPLGETGVARDGDVVRAFPVGSDVEVVVLEVDPSGRRIRLSHKAVQAAQEAEELREYAERPDATPAEPFGSLGDQLRGALGARKK